jgi:hypothetical protein
MPERAAKLSVGQATKLVIGEIPINAASERTKTTRPFRRQAVLPAQETARSQRKNLFVFKSLHTNAARQSRSSACAEPVPDWVYGRYRRSIFRCEQKPAREAHNQRTADYLVGTPNLSDELEEGLAKLGLSIEDVEKSHL